MQETFEPALEFLQQLFQAATAEASVAMRRWTHGQISLDLNGVQELPLEEVSTAVSLGDELLTMVVLTFQGEVGGDMILTFDENNGRQLAAALLHRPVSESPEWTALERSALCETGNILSCAYLNALTRFIGVELVPSPPYFVQDYGASVLEQALMVQAAQADRILICSTTFHREGEALNWNVFFVPNVAMRAAIAAAVEAAS